jgi:hypothetical protein
MEPLKLAAEEHPPESMTGLVNDVRVQRKGKQESAKEQEHRAEQLRSCKSLRDSMHCFSPWEADIPIFLETISVMERLNHRLAQT